MFNITSSSPSPSPSPPSIFQTYLLPALSFRRRTSSADSTATTTTDSGSASTRNSSNASTPASTTSSSPTTELPLATAFACDNSTPPILPSRARTYLAGHTAHVSCARCHADLAFTSQIVSKGFTGRHGRAFLVAPSPTPIPAAGSPTTSSCAPTPRPGSISRRSRSNSYYSASALLLPPSAISANPSLLPNLPNTHTHKAVPRHLVTGLHTVCDISCAVCGSVLGWKYVGAEDEAQKYKVGKFILETRKVVVGSWWEDYDQEECAGGDETGCEGFFDEVDELGGVLSWRRRASKAVSVLPLTEDDEGSADEEEDEVVFDSQDEDECEDLFAGVWSPQLASRRRSRRMSILRS